jgi:hypothetical protein
MPLPLPYAYLVILEANTTGVNYTQFTSELQRSEDWWHYMGSTWIVLRRETLVELQAKLVPMVGQFDRLLILPAKGPGAGWLPKDAWAWLERNVPRAW